MKLPIGKRAFSLLEMMMAVIILGVLVGYGMPRFQKAFEQSRVDMAVGNLETIFTAQRLYRVQNNKFASTIDALKTDFLDPSFVTNVVDNASAPFRYDIDSATFDDNHFSARAMRNNPAVTKYWSGTLTIDQTGALSGQITGNSGAIIIQPSKY